MGLTPNPPPDDGDAPDVGCPPFGAALYSRTFPARSRSPWPVFALSGHDR